MTPSVNERYLALRRGIDEVALRQGRDPSEISLISVSKNHPWSHCQGAYEAGCRDFGENKAQELEGKRLDAPEDVRWHFIGSLQKNKVNKVVVLGCTLIHSVDSLQLAEKISQVSERNQLKSSILMQVNTSGEESKQGLTLDGCKEIWPELMHLPGISLQGLMTMAPFVDSEAVIRNCFAKLRELRDLLQDRYGYPLPALSMGMSHDYPIAVSEGATLLRVGTAIFGSRMAGNPGEPS